MGCEGELVPVGIFFPVVAAICLVVAVTALKTWEYYSLLQRILADPRNRIKGIEHNSPSKGGVTPLSALGAIEEQYNPSTNSDDGSSAPSFLRGKRKGKETKNPLSPVPLLASRKNSRARAGTPQPQQLGGGGGGGGWNEAGHELGSTTELAPQARGKRPARQNQSALASVENLVSGSRASPRGSTQYLGSVQMPAREKQKPNEDEKPPAGDIEQPEDQTPPQLEKSAIQRRRPNAAADMIMNIKQQAFGSHRNSVTNKVSMFLFKKRVGVKHFDWEVPYQEIRFTEKVGEGSYGSVYHGYWLGTGVAIKVLHDQLSQSRTEKFVEEIAIMTQLHHPNVVLFLGACIELRHFLIVMEYLPIDLFSLLRSDVHMELIICHRLSADIARGMKYLHRRVNLIQRDLKSKNIMVDDNFNGKICDFGLSRHYQENPANSKLMTFCGTPYWTAPEIIRQESYTEKADVYSFAIVMWEVFSGKEPYGGVNGMEVAYAAAEDGLRPIIPDTVPEGYADLMRKCWADDQHARPGFTQVLDELYMLKKRYDHLMSPGAVVWLRAPTPYSFIQSSTNKHKYYSALLIPSVLLS
ncbi:unnamed protein product [Chrysoparadoxa australica]